MSPPSALFTAVPAELDFPADERRVLAFWKERRIFERTLQGRENAPGFVFYEGPPTANGLPHNGHVLTRVIKDLFPRYKTMRGYRVPRKAGWDTHGLPVELEHDRVAAAHDQESRSAYSRESISGEIRPPATGDDGADLARPLGRGDEGAGRAGARTEQADP